MSSFERVISHDYLVIIIFSQAYVVFSQLLASFYMLLQVVFEFIAYNIVLYFTLIKKLSMNLLKKKLSMNYKYIFI